MIINDPLLIRALEEGVLPMVLTSDLMVTCTALLYDTDICNNLEKDFPSGLHITITEPDGTVRVAKYVFDKMLQRLKR